LTAFWLAPFTYSDTNCPKSEWGNSPKVGKKLLMDITVGRVTGNKHIFLGGLIIQYLVFSFQDTASSNDEQEAHGPHRSPE
jgi:hypothetical protein